MTFYISVLSVGEQCQKRNTPDRAGPSGIPSAVIFSLKIYIFPFFSVIVFCNFPRYKKAFRLPFLWKLTPSGCCKYFLTFEVLEIVLIFKRLDRLLEAFNCRNMEYFRETACAFQLLFFFCWKMIMFKDKKASRKLHQTTCLPSLFYPAFIYFSLNELAL